MTEAILDYMEPALRPLAMPIAQLRSDPNNARKHSLENQRIIQNSLRAFGQQKPIVVDRNNICIAGNGTLAAARAIGWSHVAVVQTSLSGNDASAYAIVDNRATDTSEWDTNRLVQTLAQLQLDQAADHTLSGFSDEQIDEEIDRLVEAAELPRLPDEVQIEQAYQVLVECEDEPHQQSIFERLTGEGCTCRALTL